MSGVTSQPMPSSPSGRLLLLSHRILNRVQVGTIDLDDCGISGSLRQSLVESLEWATGADDPEIRALNSVLFSQVEDIYGFLDGLIRESEQVLERFISTGLLRRLAIGELSAPRLSGMKSLTSREAVVSTIASVLHNNCDAIRVAPATWRSATQALTSGEGTSEMMSLFLEDLGVSTQSRLSLLMYVWTQGNADAVQAVQSLAGTDDFDIVDAAFGIDGETDFPAYEVVGVSDLWIEGLSNHIADVPRVVQVFVSLMARAFERAAEHAEARQSESEQIPQIVSLNLAGNFTSTIRSRKWVIDPEFSEVGLTLERGPTAELSFSVGLKPCWFSIKTEIERREAKITLIKTNEGGSDAWPIWQVDTLVGFDGRSAMKEQMIDGFVFRLSPPILGGEEVVVINRDQNDEVRLTILWSSADKPNVPAPMLPTEIHLPPTLPSSAMMRTIPLVPRPRLVLALTTGESDPPPLSMFTRDIVSRMNIRTTCIRDLAREINSNDMIVVTDRAARSEAFQFVAGIAIGALKSLHILSQPIEDDEGLSFLRSLVDQEYARYIMS